MCPEKVCKSSVPLTRSGLSRSQMTWRLHGKKFAKPGDQSGADVDRNAFVDRERERGRESWIWICLSLFVILMTFDLILTCCVYVFSFFETFGHSSPSQGVQATCFLLREMGFSCLAPSARDFGLSGKSSHPNTLTWGYDPWIPLASPGIYVDIYTSFHPMAYDDVHSWST